MPADRGSPSRSGINCPARFGEFQRLGQSDALRLGEPRSAPRLLKAQKSSTFPPMISGKIRAELRKRLPRGELMFDQKVREQHSGDKWFASSLPDAVVMAGSAQTVS